MRTGFRLLVKCRCYGDRLQAHPQVGPIDVAVGAKLVSHPQDVTNREREAEIIVTFRAVFGRGRDRKATADQAEQLAAEVGHHRTAVAGVERGLNLNQPTELRDPSFKARSSPAM